MLSVFPHSLHLHCFFLILPLFVTICPETFSNLCVGNVRDMQEILPVKFSLLLSDARIDVVAGECCCVLS
jgi:hypothetical protein